MQPYCDNGAGRYPWVKTHYLITADEMADFVCNHSYWLNIDRSTDLPEQEAELR